MNRPDDAGNHLATAAFACGMLALALWLLSYSSVPLALAGRDIGAAWSVLRWTILAAEAGALAAALLATGLGVASRRRGVAANPHHRRASRGVVAGLFALVLVVGLNALGWIFA